MAVGYLPLLALSLSLPFKGKAIMLSVSWWCLGKRGCDGQTTGACFSDTAELLVSRG